MIPRKTNKQTKDPNFPKTHPSRAKSTGQTHFPWGQSCRWFQPHTYIYMYISFKLLATEITVKLEAELSLHTLPCSVTRLRL